VEGGAKQGGPEVYRGGGPGGGPGEGCAERRGGGPGGGPGGSPNLWDGCPTAEETGEPVLEVVGLCSGAMWVVTPRGQLMGGGGCW